MRREVLKGHLDLLLLAALRDEPAHGYRVVELLRERSGGLFELGEGTIYPALYRLERAGLLASAWSSASGRRRRVYRLTARGGRMLGEKRREWNAFAHAVGAVVA
ncbi:MAG TPA: helix-turn-helix transcriptional regulator [Gaiellaceae bacterium]|nr:helix-turn-helix transcriptional regulator [Gaiellaceae bacterium]